MKVRGGRAVRNRRARRWSSAGRAAHRPTGHGSIEVGTGVGAGEGAAVGGVVGTGVGKDVGKAELAPHSRIAITNMLLSNGEQQRWT